MDCTVVAPNIVEPDGIREMPPGGALAEWLIDRDRGTATLVRHETRLGRLTLPLAPMLGCFGVAPPGGQAINRDLR